MLSTHHFFSKHNPALTVGTALAAGLYSKLGASTTTKSWALFTPIAFPYLTLEAAWYGAHKGQDTPEINCAIITMFTFVAAFAAVGFITTKLNEQQIDGFGRENARLDIQENNPPREFRGNLNS